MLLARILGKIIITFTRAKTRKTGSLVKRKEPCSFCGEKSGLKIAEVRYWDLATCSVIHCEKCELTQLDPKLSKKATADGCTAYYLREAQHATVKSEFRNNLRNFRRGIALASQLKNTGFNPQKILELGPGSGFFSVGVQAVWPQARITVADIVPEVLALNNEQHHFDVLHSDMESLGQKANTTYDLVIARDVIEHVNYPEKNLQAIYKILNPGGFLHFSMPAGNEDVWGLYSYYQNTQKAGLMLLNHVNYFEGESLPRFLIKIGFKEWKIFIYGAKDHLRGKGVVLADTNGNRYTGSPAARKLIDEFNGKARPGLFPIEKKYFLPGSIAPGSDHCAISTAA